MPDKGPLDGVGEVREEDAFDVAAVERWLARHASDRVGGSSASDGAGGGSEHAGADGRAERDPAGEHSWHGGIVAVGQFAGGASNLTYLLSCADGTELVLRRPPTGTKARGAHDMAREHDLQAALAGHLPVPRMVGLCRDEAVIGSEFYVMERLSGTILRRDVPAELGLDAAAAERLGRSMVAQLADIHAVDLDAAGLRALDRGPGYVARQVGGWTGRYRAARTPDVGDLEEVMGWLQDHQPADVDRVLIHNDFRLDNLVLQPGDPTTVIGVLDWELATVGDPLMDLGSALAYWVQADDDPMFVATRLQPSTAPGMPTREQILREYQRVSGRQVPQDEWRFYEVFGLFRLAVIAQQIYQRHALGQTSNPRYAAFGPMVRALETRCRRLLDLPPEPGRPLGG